MNESGTNKESSRRVRQIMLFSEFSTDIRHISGNDNTVADTSKGETITYPTSPRLKNS